MSKKRVHEIAKELKSHGIELDNKEVVTELLSLGYDVKSHSSSLEDDQATAAVQKILDKRKPKQAAPPMAAKGFVVRRKVGPTAGELAEQDAAAEAARQEAAYAESELQESYDSAPEGEAQNGVSAEPSGSEQPEHVNGVATAALSTPDPVASERLEPVTAAEAPAHTTVAEPAPVLESSATPVLDVTARPESTPEVPTKPQTTPPTDKPAFAAPFVPGSGAASGASQPPPARPPQSMSPRPNQAVVISRPATVVSRPGQPGARSISGMGRPGVQIRQGTARPNPSNLPPLQGPPRAQGPGARPGVPNSPNMGGRSSVMPQRSGHPSATSTAQASASPQPGGHSIQAGGHASGHNPALPPHQQARPTATQAVVISRPLIQVRRVTPSSTAHKNIPMAPGRKAIGEVREFKVVPDHLGRGRELVDVSKNKAEQARGKKRTEKEGTFNTQEMKDLVWGRITIPIRGKKRKPTKKGAKTQITVMAEDKKVIKLQDVISVSELSQRMGVKTSEIIKKLMAGGTMATANQVIDAVTAGVISADYGWKIEKVGFEVEDHLPELPDKPEDERPRPPVIAVMGHVDHGKTSLLDAIRQSNVASGEAGGITQHIGAYTVKTAKGDVTFLDTPGHEAFTSMRARGANVTDIVILVVAADDGVMPQTVEAIAHAKAAGVPIVVAINKMDVPGANADRVKKDLADQGLNPEEWGGDTIMVPVSARQKTGIDLLLENVALQAEVLELKANPLRPAVGAVIEAKLEKGRGPVATVLVQDGTLHRGDSIVTGTHYGRIRAMVNSRGETVETVLPGYCAEVIGLSGPPSAGDAINVVADEKAAKEIADHRMLKERQSIVGTTAKESLEALFAKAKAGESKELRLVLKADVQGSSEAVAQAVMKLSTPKVKVDIIHKGVGAMTESDVMLAAASKGMVVGFNVKSESGSEAAAKHEGVIIQNYTIIYELIDGVRLAMEGLLEPIRTEKRLGRAEVRSLFNVPKLGTIAGAAVIDGTIKRSSLVRVVRDNKQVFIGKTASLRRFKDDVREVATGFECGIGIENYNDLKPGDIIEAYEIEETRPSLA